MRVNKKKKPSEEFFLFFIQVFLFFIQVLFLSFMLALGFAVCRFCMSGILRSRVGRCANV
jgi:hypothetical protein